MGLNEKMHSHHHTRLIDRDQLGELKLSGVGFRAYTYRDRTVLNIGYSHLIVVWAQTTTKTRRQRLLTRAAYLHRYQTLKHPDPYRQRGMQNLARPLKFKEGKKR